MSEPYYCENYIDIFSVNTFKLAVYPQYIVFGSPIFDINLQKAKFNTQTSLKIPEICLDNWLDFLNKVSTNFFEDQSIQGQQVIYSDLPIEEKHKNQLQNQKNCFFYELLNIEDSANTKVTISSTYLTIPLHFTLDSYEFLQFCQAFSTIFFKMYCYTPTQNLCINNFVQTENSGYIIECTLYEVFLHLKAQTLLPLSISECIRIAELIMRHKHTLIKWKKLAVLF